jgi:hypothetical protein
MPILYIPPVVLFVFVLAKDSPSPWESGALVLCIVGFALLAYRTLTMQVSVTDADVKVRNVFWTRVFGWDEIDRFDWGTQYGFRLGGVYLTDGRFIRASALASPLAAQADKEVPKALAGLTAELARHRQSNDVAPMPELPADTVQLSLPQDPGRGYA